MAVPMEETGRRSGWMLTGHPSHVTGSKMAAPMEGAHVPNGTSGMWGLNPDEEHPGRGNFFPRETRLQSCWRG